MADIGWITGHSYIVYGPLANAATSVLYEGVPTFPDAGRPWRIAERSEEHTSELQSPCNLVCRLLLEKKKKKRHLYKLKTKKCSSPSYIVNDNVLINLP